MLNSSRILMLPNENCGVKFWRSFGGACAPPVRCVHARRCLAEGLSVCLRVGAGPARDRAGRCVPKSVAYAEGARALLADPRRCAQKVSGHCCRFCIGIADIMTKTAVLKGFLDLESIRRMLDDRSPGTTCNRGILIRRFDRAYEKLEMLPK